MGSAAVDQSRGVCPGQGLVAKTGKLQQGPLHYRELTLQEGKEQGGCWCLIEALSSH